MTASSMDHFVRSLLNETNDYSSLSQRSIREAYMRHTGVPTLPDASKELLKQIVSCLVMEKEAEANKSIEPLPAQEDNSNDIEDDEMSERKDNGESDVEEKNLPSKQKLNGKSAVKKSFNAKEALGAVLNSDDDMSRQSGNDNSDLPVDSDQSDEKKAIKKMSSKKARRKPSADSKSDKKSVKQNNGKNSQIVMIGKKRSRASSGTDSDDFEDMNQKHKMSDSDSDDGQVKKRKKKKGSGQKGQVKGSNKSKHERDISTGSGNCSDEDTLASVKKQFNQRVAISRSSDSEDSSNEENLRSNIANGSHPAKKKVKKQQRERSLPSDEEFEAKKKKKKLQTQDSRTTKKSSASSEKSSQLIQLEKIARHCGVLPVGLNYTAAFKDCETDHERCSKLRQMLSDAGMKGPPSMKAAKRLKLDKEIRELSQNNIISSSEGRTKRNVFSIYSRNEYRPVDREPDASLKETFSNLKGIVDSDDDSSG